MKHLPLIGDLNETPFVDVLDYYCTSGQTVAIAVIIPRVSGGEATGAFFVDAGVLIDARFDGREGADAVRQALRLHRGRYQVESGSRSSRRTVHEPWEALAPPTMERQAPPRLFPVDGSPRPTPPPTPGARPAVSAPAATATAAAHGPSDAHPVPPPLRTPSGDAVPVAAHARAPAVHATGELHHAPSPSARGLAEGTPAVAAAAGTVGAAATPHPSGGAPRPATPPPSARPGTRDVIPAASLAAAGAKIGPPPGMPSAGPLTSGPRPLHTSGPSTSPFSGPHTPPPRTHAGAPPTAPFSSVRRDPGLRRFLLPAALIGLAVVMGGGLAVGMAKLMNRSAVAALPAATATVAASTVPAVPGVSDTEITVGMAAPFTGVSRELGRQMKVGLDVAFARVNAEGGVQGRKLKLVAIDDGYEPTRTREVVRELAEQRGVFGFVGNVGTPTAAVAVPYALEHKLLFFGPFTGAPLLRKEPPDRYVFNYRASYAEETAAIVRYLVEVRRIKPEQIAVFAQDDAYGDAGFQGVARVLRPIRRASSNILKVTYKRNTSDVLDAVAKVLDRKANVAAVVMVATYRPAARFIEKVREQRPGMVFTNVSFVGSQALAEELVLLGPQYAQGVIVTQVVPLPTGQSTVGMRYREALGTYAPGEKPDFISLEGYVTGNLLVEGLKRAGRNLTIESLVEALEGIRGLDLGQGAPISFGLSEHQGSHKVWGTVLDAAGSFQPLELE